MYRATVATISSSLLIGITILPPFHSPAASQIPIPVTPAPAASPSTESSPLEPSPSLQDLQEARQNLLNLEPIPSPVPDATEEEWPEAKPDTAEPSAPVFGVYRLGPGDSLFVNVPNFPDLSFQVTLDFDGNILIPLAGTIPLQGLTVPEAEQVIQRELNRFVINPEVDAVLVAQRPVQVTVLGEVLRPGYYPLQAPLLAVALASAGGTTTLADLRIVRIRRSLNDGTVVEETLDLYTPMQQGTGIPDLQLQDGDTIVIPTLTASASETYDRDLVARSTLAQTDIVIRILNYAVGGGRSVEARLIRISLPNGSSFLDAIAAVTPNPDRANLSDVALIRFEPAAGGAVVQELNVRDALYGDLSQDPPLAHNDVIVIGRNLLGRITYVLSTISQPFQDVLGFLLFIEQFGTSADNFFGGDENSSGE